MSAQERERGRVGWDSENNEGIVTCVHVCVTSEMRTQKIRSPQTVHLYHVLSQMKTSHLKFNKQTESREDEEKNMKAITRVGLVIRLHCC